MTAYHQFPLLGDPSITVVGRWGRRGGCVEAVEEGGAYAVDLMQLVRDKIYQKYGDSGFYSALRRACLAGVGAHERFESLGKHGRLQASFVAVLRCSHTDVAVFQTP